MAMNTDQLLEMYTSLYETWRFEVNSHWQRSSYFAAFETVAVAACWIVSTTPSGHYWAEAIVSVLGIALTAVWFLSNNKTHEYALFWLDAAGLVEKKLIECSGEGGIDFAVQVKRRPRKDAVYIRHPTLVQIPPMLFLAAWMILFGVGVRQWVVQFRPNQTPMKVEVASLAIGLAPYFLFFALLIARSSLSQAKYVAARDRRDWKQRKWFDVYAKVDEAYDRLDYFQTIYPSVDSPGWGSSEWEQEWAKLITALRAANRMASVFPVNPVINKLFEATAAFKDLKEAVSKERLSKIFDAVEEIRQQARVDAAVLEE